ncbi:hypothetical protein ACQEU8_35810 [Streptomyces sp. CA-250714]|uniref:hypothetical protein n=1 Tax=Streptomyces sp. CA-250714 TaxID=3240060 RepID=UPI003D9052A9
MFGGPAGVREGGADTRFAAQFDGRVAQLLGAFAHLPGLGGGGLGVLLGGRTRAGQDRLRIAAGLLPAGQHLIVASRIPGGDRGLVPSRSAAVSSSARWAACSSRWCNCSCTARCWALRAQRPPAPNCAAESRCSTAFCST